LSYTKTIIEAQDSSKSAINNTNLSPINNFKKKYITAAQVEEELLSQSFDITQIPSPPMKKI
jgi:hypothetical protein